jgi:hypothetical protein
MWGIAPVVKSMASANEVFPTPILEIMATFLSDSAGGWLMGSSSC